MSERPGARELIDLVLDPGSFRSWDQPVDMSSYSPGYRRELRAAATKAGTDESVLTGTGLLAGRRVAVIVSEFRFLAGSIGRAAAGRIVAAVRRATAEGLPLLAATSSGGTRMQEGTPAFTEMVAITRAVMAHRQAGLPYLVHLRHPTTGGVFASWGSLGHVTTGQPGALVGFLGPKVYQALNDRAFPGGVQTAENLADKGVIDAVVDDRDLRAFLDSTLAVLVDPPSPAAVPPRADDGRDENRSAWGAILRTRRADRAGVRDLLRHGGARTVRLRGTGEGEREDGVLLALTRFDGQPCVVVGQDRSRQSGDAPLGPGALRQARRGMRLAEELRLPLVTVIDTPGAELSPRAEERAMAGEIARCVGALTTLTVPTVSVLLGQGCGGGALALLPARIVIATENAWLAPLPPEGASVIMHGDTEHTVAMAEAQGIRAADLLATGVVHHVVPEHAGDTQRTLALAVTAAVASALVTESRQEVRLIPRPRSAAPAARLTACDVGDDALLTTHGRALT
jgi:acetyl-CoA carboxylase carboxyl transferase subunit beta